MKRRMLFMLLAGALLSTAAVAQEAVHDAHTHNGPGGRLEFDNDRVQVVRIRLDPHAKTEMHAVTERVVVWLTQTRLRIVGADGTIHEERHARGEVNWVPAGRHAGENLGDQPIEFLAMVPKR
jgi:hypothetical protein